MKRFQTFIHHNLHTIIQSSNPPTNTFKARLTLHKSCKRKKSTATIIHHLNNRKYSLNISSNTLFNRLRDDASKSSLSELTFKDMVQYSRSAHLFNIDKYKNDTNGVNPKTNTKNGINGQNNTKSKKISSNNNPAYLIESAEYVRKQLLIIIARIVIDFQILPYGVSSNSRIEQNMQSYIDSYTAIKQIPSIKSPNDKILFHETLERHLSSWAQVSLYQIYV